MPPVSFFPNSIGFKKGSNGPLLRSAKYAQKKEDVEAFKEKQIKVEEVMEEKGEDPVGEVGSYDFSKLVEAN